MEGNHNMRWRDRIWNRNKAAEKVNFLSQQPKASNSPDPSSPQDPQDLWQCAYLQLGKEDKEALSIHLEIEREDLGPLNSERIPLNSEHILEVARDKTKARYGKYEGGAGGVLIQEKIVHDLSIFSVIAEAVAKLDPYGIAQIATSILRLPIDVRHYKKAGFYIT